MINKAIYLKSCISNKDIENDIYPEFMFCGRSNVGKSSFINALVNQNNLARTSQNPGKTQTLNIYFINDSIYFVDVPGYGYANVSKQTKQKFGIMIEDYIKNTNKLKKVFLLVDFRHTPTNDDLLMYEFLKYYNKDIVVIATKSDKVKNKDRKKNKEEILKKLNINESNLIITSSSNKEGINIIRKMIVDSI